MLIVLFWSLLNLLAVQYFVRLKWMFPFSYHPNFCLWTVRMGNIMIYLLTAVHTSQLQPSPSSLHVSPSLPLLLSFYPSCPLLWCDLLNLFLISFKLLTTQHYPVLPCSALLCPILSVGFTTSLQLRETPVFLKTLIAPSESEETTTNPRVSGTVAVPVEQVEAGDRYVKYVLQPRQRLNVSKFIIARFVGLLPIMWLGLLINVPSWMNENNSRQPAKTQVTSMHMSLSLSYHPPPPHHV